MKKTTFLAAMAMCLMLSCQKAQTISEKERGLNLKAPSGDLVANGISALKLRTVKVIQSQGLNSEDFEIISINYLQVKKGVAAVIYYQLQDGTFDGYAFLSGVRYVLTPSGLRVFLNEATTQGQRAGDQSFVCVKTNDCTGKCKAPPEIILTENGEFGGFDCGCSDKCETKEVQ
ncbi:MAG: hypothetical protein WCF67_17995 [Chitinophagaceae bacterium]